MQNQVKRYPHLVLLVIFSAALGILMGTQETGRPTKTKVALGKLMEIRGVIVERAPDRFTLRDHRGTEITVTVTDHTEIGEKKKNFLRTALNYSAEELLLGLHVEVKGHGDNFGNLLAEKIKFTQDELTVARTISSRVSPVEKSLDKAHARLDKAEERFDENSQVVSGQISELNDAFRTARGEAQEAQQTADKAQVTADQAISFVDDTNKRVTALDDYEEMKVLMVWFKFDSAALSEEGKRDLDGLVKKATAEKGVLIEVTGFASADGNEAYNLRLSRRRAESVVRYLTENHKIPLRRILTPYGYGELNPVAENTTLEGRKQNRRVQVRVLANRGIAEPATVVSTQPQRN